MRKKNAVLIIVAVLFLFCLFTQFMGIVQRGTAFIATRVTKPTPTITSTPRPTLTPTWTPLPLQISGWGVTTVHVLCLKVEQSYPQIEGIHVPQISQTIRYILSGVGILVVDEGKSCDASLNIMVIFHAIGASYLTKYCYSGAWSDTQASFSTPNHLTQTWSFKEEYSPPLSLLESACSQVSGDAPFEAVWPKPILRVLAQLWGPQPLIYTMESKSAWITGGIHIAADELYNEMEP